MGVFTNLKQAFGTGLPRPEYLASPFTEAQLTQIVWSDVFEGALVPMTRAEAMTIPSMSKARNLICATIAKLPLVVRDERGKLAVQPEWVYRTNTAIGPFQRMLWTLDDLLFFGRSLWEVVRDSDGVIIDAERVAIETWSVTNEGAIKIGERFPDAADVIYFPGPIEGVLDKDATTLRAAKNTSAAVASRVRAPIPVMEIHATGEDEPSKEEARAIVASYNAARRDPEGATVYTPSGVQLISHGDKGDSGFMVEGRNAVRLDVANLTGVPAALLDGSTSTASLTYSTQEGRRNEFVDFSLVLWMEAIADRLSADDVVARGLSVAFDQTDYLATLPAATGIPKED